MVSLAINGFGRIGRLVFRAAVLNYPQIEIIAVNTSGSMDITGWAHLLKYDSVYGPFPKEIKIEKEEGKEGKIGKLIIDQKSYPFLAIREPEKIPWGNYQTEIVFESTGVFRHKELASKHFTGGAKKIIISAPPKGEGVPLYLLGVNEKNYQGESLISNGSCTTNCAAPVCKVILESFGIEKASMTTVHAYTADQQLVDGSHRDLQRARAAAMNIIPTTTGAAKSVIATLPQVKDRFTASALRVPVICGSISDFTFKLKKKTTKEEVRKIFQDKANGKLKGILTVTDEPLVSRDIIGNPASAVVLLNSIEVIQGDFLKILAWYDNEWAYACRLIELAIYISSYRK